MHVKCLKKCLRRTAMISGFAQEWTATISVAGYAQHGLATQAIELLEVMMPKSGTKPDAVTYLGVLSSCRHAGLAEEGRRFFESMAEHGLKPELRHYSCLVDLLGRFGLQLITWNVRIMPKYIFSY